MGLKGSAGCHLPHVIRANQKRIGIAKVPRYLEAASASATPAAFPIMDTAPTLVADAIEEPSAWNEPGASTDVSSTSPAAVSAGMPAMAISPSAGPVDPEEFISLTFEESDEDDEDEDEDDDDEDDDDGDGDEDA